MLMLVLVSLQGKWLLSGLSLPYNIDKLIMKVLALLQPVHYLFVVRAPAAMSIKQPRTVSRW